MFHAFIWLSEKKKQEKKEKTIEGPIVQNVEIESFTLIFFAEINVFVITQSKVQKKGNRTEFQVPVQMWTVPNLSVNIMLLMCFCTVMFFSLWMRHEVIPPTAIFIMSQVSLCSDGARFVCFGGRCGFAKWLCREGGNLAFKASLLLLACSELAYPTSHVQKHTTIQRFAISKQLLMKLTTSITARIAFKLKWHNVTKDFPFQVKAQLLFPQRSHETILKERK